MENLTKELAKFEKNFQYVLESDLLYPNIHSKDRKKLIGIYNTIFAKNIRISITCSRCIKPYLKELALWYNEHKCKGCANCRCNPEELVKCEPLGTADPDKVVERRPLGAADPENIVIIELKDNEKATNELVASIFQPETNQSEGVVVTDTESETAKEIIDDKPKTDYAARAAKAKATREANKAKKLKDN